MHSTNYENTFIEVAEDCRAAAGEIPPDGEPKSLARQQYDMLVDAPYQYTSDDILYAVSGAPKGLSREAFFAKGQPCLRASALGKRYGWGVHSDSAGRVAIYGRETDTYRALADDPAIRHLKAMKNKR